MSLSFIIITFLVAITGFLGCIVLRGELVKRVGTGSNLTKLHWIHLGDFVSSALIVFGVTLFLGDIGVLRPYFEKQLSNTLFGMTESPEFLRKNLGEEARRSLRKTTIFSLCKEARLGADDPFYKVIENDILPMLDGPIRENHIISYDHKIVSIDGRERLQITRTDEFTMKNTTAKPKLPYKQRFKIVSQREGKFPYFVKEKVMFKINDKKVKFPYSIDRDSTGDFVIIDGDTILEIEDKLDIFFSYTLIDTLIDNDHFGVWELYPTRNIKVQYTHDKRFKPELYLFALADFGPSFPRDRIKVNSDSTYHEWKYDGWLLQKHGVLLTWKLEKK